MKNCVLSTIVILVYVVSVALISVQIYLEVYTKALDKRFCGCEGFSPEEVRQRATQEVKESELEWIAAFFLIEKNNSSSKFDYFYFCTGTGGYH